MIHPLVSPFYLLMLTAISIYLEHLRLLRQHGSHQILYFHLTSLFDHLLVLLSLFSILVIKDDRYLCFLLTTKRVKEHVRYHKQYTILVPSYS